MRPPAAPTGKGAPTAPGAAERWITGAFGLLFVVLAVIILTVQADTVGPWIAALVLAVLGGQSMLAALRGHRSWLARIGPLL